LERLKPLKEALPPEITFEEIRLVVARPVRLMSKGLCQWVVNPAA